MRFNQFLRSTLAATALCGVMFAAAAPASAAEEAKLNSWLGPTHPLNTGGYEPFIKTVEAESKGSIKFKLFQGGSLLDSRGTLPGIRDGVVEGGFVVMSFHPAEFPSVATFTDLAMVGTDSLSAAAAVTETVLLHCPSCAEEAKAQNFLFFGAYATTAYNIMSAKPVHSLADMKGMKVRSFGGAIDRWLSSIGAVAVNVDATHAYEGLSKKTLDAVMLPVADLQSYNLWDVAPYVNLLKVGSFKSNSAVGFNRDYWKSLTPDERAIMLKNAPIMALGPGFDYIKNDENVATDAAAHKVTLIEPDPKIVAELGTFFESDKEAIFAAATARGVKDPGAVVDTYLQLVAKYDKLFEGKRGDKQALYDILYQEVYAKLGPDFGME